MRLQKKTKILISVGFASIITLVLFQNATFYKNIDTTTLGDQISDPSVFVAKDYLEINPDVARAGVDPKAHWETYGISNSECRKSSWKFSARDYMKANPDIAQKYNNDCRSVVLHYVGLPPTIATITANPARIMPGEQATLNYNSSSATSCTLSGGGVGWDGPVAPEAAGSVVVSPTKTTTYTLTCTGPKGTTSASIMVWVGLVTTATPCDQNKRQEILETATAGKQEVRVNCRLDLQATDLITKRIVIEGSDANGTRINCNGATIAPQFKNSDATDAISVVSKKTSTTEVEPLLGTWSRPYDVAINGCKLVGRIKLVGLPLDVIERSSKHDEGEFSQHTKRAQDNAPSKITFRNLDITAKYGENTVFYAYQGANNISLINNNFHGATGGSPAIYFNPETAYNIIKGNTFNVDTTKPPTYSTNGPTIKYPCPTWSDPFRICSSTPFAIEIPSLYQREVMSLDGSAYNKIIGNNFFGLGHGGIFLYRNCGEGGAVRHQTPNHNQIINNIFNYPVNFSSSKPAIHVSSRDLDGSGQHCNEDAGYRYGSSIDNKDYATDTAIIGNRFYNFSPESMIRIGSISLFGYPLANVGGSPGWVFGSSGSINMQQNIIVRTGEIVLPRSSQCYEYSEGRVYQHDEARSVSGINLICNDGQWVSPLLGYLNPITYSSGVYNLNGWACLKDNTESISVDLHLNGPDGIGTLFRNVNANVKTTSGIDAQCGTTGVPHTFSYKLTSDEFSAHNGKTVFATAISGIDNIENKILSGSGLKIPKAKVLGNLNPITSVAGQYVLNGWACLKDVSKSINVHFYVDGASGKGGTFLGATKANVATASDIDSLCGTTGIPHGFSYKLKEEQFSLNRGKAIFVHGISGVVGVPNDELTNSGARRLPEVAP